MDCPAEPSEGAQPCQHLGYRLLTSRTRGGINFHRFKPLSSASLHFGTAYATLGNTVLAYLLEDHKTISFLLCLNMWQKKFTILTVPAYSSVVLSAFTLLRHRHHHSSP